MSASSPSTGPLPLKARVGSYSVVLCTPDRLELRGHRGMSIGVILGGLLASALGILNWWAFLTNNGHASTKALILPLVGPLLIAGGVKQLGTGLVFDRNGRAMRKGKLSAGAPAACDPVGAVFRPRHVVTVEIVPTNLHQRESVAVRVEGPGADRVLLGIRRTNERDAATLLAAAGHIANLIEAPVRVSGESKEGGESFKYTLDALRSLSRPIAPESLAA